VVPPSLQVVFIGTKPTSAQAEAVLRACITVVAAKFAVPREMLANAWFAKVSPSADDEGPLTLPDGSDALVFDPIAKRTRTFSDRNGVQPTTRNAGPYFTVYREDNVIVPPYGKFASLDVVFPPGKVPEADIYKALVQEMEKAVRAQSPRLSTSAYAKSGVKANSAGQVLIRGNDGKYIRVECDPKDGKIRDRRGTVLGTTR
jgi:hypothetical protein